MPDPDLTRASLPDRAVDQICTKGSAGDERNVSAAEKKTVCGKYAIETCPGYRSGRQGCEIDPLIGLEIGGANAEDNRWPQPCGGDGNAHDKDRLENMLHPLVCRKTITLKEAQTAIRTDRIAACRKYLGAWKPHAATNYCPK